ncbi:MAG: NAD(P)H-quinone oxidoreductase [Rhodocyclaceae bacterium]|jgi:NADPH2:quinone reductase|nr:NAD(P)H-quinone oxidoreductase [Rhodocyclaceae bacterium]MBK6906962.1 NAD(P)H-quinone oxidoreductase [Rhodocyclaceae bacterium]
MKAILHGTGGDPECMVLGDSDIPQPGCDELLIKVAASGVNRPDVFQRQGRYPPPPDASPILGLEVAGEVVAVGANVDEWKIGDTVTALAPGGGYAEFCCVPAGCALPVPAGLSLIEAAALPETWFTVWSNLIQRAHLQRGERLLVHGGASGIGLTAIQLAKMIGADCIVTVGSAEKAAFCERFGAVRAINYREHDFAEAVREATRGDGVDVILDIVGGPYLKRNLDLLRRDGRLVHIAFLQGARAEMDLMPVMLKRLTITGSTLRPASRGEKSVIGKELLASVWPRISAGLRPHICATFPLAAAAKAHQLMESNRHIGKIVLTVGSDSKQTAF